MASESRAPGGDAGRAGGKLYRTRRRAAALAASPYYRQEEASPAVASPLTTAKSWFSGIGRILTSVFGSESGSDSSCSCTSESDSDDLHEGEHRHGLHKDANITDELGIKLIESQGARHQHLATTSKTKLLIEKLLQQETYSRDESKKLIEIIQSRAVESPVENDKNGMSVDFPSGTTYGVASSPGLLGSSLRHSLLGKSPESPSYLSTFHLSSFVDQVCTPCSTGAAIMEAKKWVEEKRLTSSSKLSLGCGPCTLNTDSFHNEHENGKESRSPVDIAKSYMQALPPWQSPISSRDEFRIPSAALKRSQFEAALWDAHDATQHVNQQLDAAPPVLGTSVPSKETLELNPLHSSSATCEKLERVFEAYPDSNSVQNKSLLDEIENVKSDCPDAVPSTDEADGTKNGLPCNNETFNERLNIFDNNVMESEGSLHVGHECTAATVLPSETKVQDKYFALGHAIERNQVGDLEQPLPVEEQAGTVTVHGNSVAEHNDASVLVEDALNAEPISVPEGSTICSLLSNEEIPVANMSNPNLQRRSVVENISRGDNSADARFDDEHKQIQKQAIDLHSRNTSNGVSSHSGSSARLQAAGKSADSHDVGNKRRKTRNGGLGGDASGLNCNVSGEASIDVPDSQPQLGDTMKSTEQMLTEVPRSSSRGRGTKPGKRGRRARGLK